MPVAALTKEIQIPPDQLILWNIVGLGLLFAGVYVWRKIMRRVGIRGGLVRSDLFGLPDVLVSGTLVVLLLLLLVAMHWGSSAPPNPADAHGGGVTGLQIIYSALQFALPVGVILAFLIARGISVPLVFGLGRVGLFRAIGTAAGLVVLLLPVFLLVTSLAYRFLDGHAEPQELVKIYEHAAKSGKNDVVWQVMVAAVFIAPITEEILFRGYFYAVLKRIAGPLPAGLGISLLFGAVHNNALGMPGLTVLALGLTLAYEWSGSILVSIFMHAWFNAISLFAMWWGTRHGLTL